MRVQTRPKLRNSMVTTIDRRGQVLREAVGQTFLGGRPEDAGWTGLSSSNLGRDLPQTMYDKHIRLSFAQYRQNPMAKRLINMATSFIIGSGITISSDKKDVLEVLTGYWNDPYNNWPARIVPRVTDLLLYGEWAHIPVVTQDGLVRIRGVQPDAIQEIRPSVDAHDTPDVAIFKSIVLPNGETKKEFPLPIIRYRMDPASGQLDDFPSGEIFVFGLNRTSDTMRGVGELFALIDYIDVYDETLFNRAEAVANRSAVWFDLKLEGMNIDEINKYLQQETELPPRPGTLWAHNEKAELKAVVPDMQAPDHAEDARVIHSHIVSGAGWPGTFFDDPGTAGRAVGAEMAEPAYKNIIMLQGQVREFLKEEMNYVLWHAVKAGRVEKFEPEAYYISFGRPSARDIQRIGPAMARLGDFLNMMWNDNLLDRDQAAAIALSQINQLGLADAPLTANVGEDPRIAKAKEAEKALQMKMAQPAPVRGGNGATPRSESNSGREAERANGR